MHTSLMLLWGNWNSQNTGTGAGIENGNGNFSNHFYSSDSTPVRFTELYKPSH